MNLLPAHIDTSDRPPLECVSVAHDPLGSPVPAVLADRIMVDVIHDGNVIPDKFLRGQYGHPLLGEAKLPKESVRERDWGAELIASSLASSLHLGKYYRVTTARTLLDFGRFPGITPADADHLSRYAINYPFSAGLSYIQKRQLLESYYDRISEGMDAALNGKLLKIAIHTYDKRNPSMFERPSVSILTRPLGHQHLSSRPFPHFDPAFPAKVIEYTADRLLRSRIAQTLEEASIHTADNFPYSLPEGSVEVRAQVWYFFQHARQSYQGSAPPRALSVASGRCPRELVWNMLMDTNLRSAESQALRSYLHMFRNAPAGDEELFLAAREEYERIADFLRREKKVLVDQYRDAQYRPSTILIEVRKDLVWDFENGVPKGPRTDNAQFISRKIAIAIQQYLDNDRLEKSRSSINRTFL